MSAPAPSLAVPAKTLADWSWAVGACAALLLLAAGLFDGRLLNDSDTYWHLAAGDWMLSHLQVPHTDPFSFSYSGAPWHAHEWLSEVVMALAFSLGRWNGLAILNGLSLAATAWLLAKQLGRTLSGLALPLTLLLAFACMAPSFLARPHLLALPILVAWTGALLRAREEDHAPPLWMAGLMLVWANLHGSFVFGFLLLGCFALEALLESPTGRRWEIARAWTVFAVTSTAAAAITPQGLSGLLFPFALMKMSGLAHIGEWHAMDFSVLSPFELALLAFLFVCMTRGVTVAPIRALLLLVLLHMALQHARHALVAAPVAAMLLARPLAQTMPSIKQSIRPAAAGSWFGFAAIALALIATRTAMPIARSDDLVTPAQAFDHVPRSLRSQHVLNQYDFGGYLIFEGIRPYIDSRADLYGDAFLSNYARIISPDRMALEKTLREAHIAWTIFAPDTPIAAMMDRETGWKRLYTDRFATIHVRAESVTARR